jgi:hypothetical protein
MIKSTSRAPNKKNRHSFFGTHSAENIPDVLGHAAHVGVLNDHGEGREEGGEHVVVKGDIGGREAVVAHVGWNRGESACEDELPTGCTRRLVKLPAIPNTDELEL